MLYKLFIELPHYADKFLGQSFLRFFGNMPGNIPVIRFGYSARYCCHCVGIAVQGD